MVIKKLLKKIKYFMLDKVNRFIEDQKLKNRNNPTSSNSDLNIQLILVEKLNIIIDILKEIKNKQFNIISSQGSDNRNDSIKIKENERPFIPTINTSEANIRASDIQKRTRKIDLKDSIHKLKKMSN